MTADRVEWPMASTRARMEAVVIGMDAREADAALAASLPLFHRSRDLGRGEIQRRDLGWDESPAKSIALAAIGGSFEVPADHQALWFRNCEAMVDVVRDDVRERRDLADAFLLHVANLVVVGGRASLAGLPERTRDDFVATVRDHAVAHPDRTTGLLEAAGLLGCMMLTAPAIPGWDPDARRDARFAFERDAFDTAAALVEALGPRAFGDEATKRWILDLASTHLAQ